MEQEKFSDEMDPLSENPQLLRGRTLSRLVDERFSPFIILSPTHTFFALFHRGGKKSGKRTETSISIKLIPKLALLQQDDQSERAGEKRKR
jgi:hypothetical protein